MPSPSVRLTSNESRGTHQTRALKLLGARVAVDAQTAIGAEVEIEGHHIRCVTFEDAHHQIEHQRQPEAVQSSVDLTGYLILPGVINAHDHLELNLFPRTGSGPYPNSRRWAEDVYHPDDALLRRHLAVPHPVRLWWGGIKNLLCGATTVCHHNPFTPEVFNEDFPVRVVSRYGWEHSIAFGKDIPGAIRTTPPGAPFIIHLGEGTDEESRNEIFELDRVGALDSRTVIVHGVALDEAGQALLRQRGGALIWCPTSNVFMLGKTLDCRRVRQTPRIALGSDSALTAEGDLLDEVRVAHEVEGVSPGEIFRMVTRGAAEVLHLAEGEGTLKPGSIADLIAIPDQGCPPGAALAKSSFRDIELVVVKGEPRLLSPVMAGRWPREYQEGLASLRVEKVERWIRAPMAWLFQETRKQLGSDIRLAGKRVSE